MGNMDNSVINTTLELILLLFTLMLINTVKSQASKEQTIQFSVIEEANNTYVGDISTSSSLVNRYQQNVIATFKYEKSLNPNQDQTLFTLNRDDGIVRTAKPIDREKYCASKESCSLSLDVTITEPINYFQVLNLQIEILDENDNAPLFDQTHIEIQVSESAPIGTKRRILTEAKDKDSPLNGVNKDGYRLQSNIQGLFGIHNDNTGLYLVLEHKLNRESASTYSLKLMAYDKGTPIKSSSMSIDIIVTDANDNPPEFSQQVYTKEIAEDYPLNQPILQVITTDKDIGVNAKASYTLGTLSKVSYGDVFGINQTTGVLYLKNHLDYESQTEYSLEVVARDGGSDSQMATCTVTITVTDINDNTPQVKINTLTNKPVAEINETSPKGAFVAFVAVSDGDSGDNGQVSCTLDHRSFQLEALQNKNQFKVTTKEPLDRETTASYSIPVLCTDSGIPQRKGNGTVNVIVIDTNDHYPVFFKKQYNVSVPENSNIGSFIEQVLAVDADIGINGQVTYSIINTAAKEYVEIGSADGILRIAKKLDYETFRHLTIHVKASDGSEPPNTNTTTVFITVTDSNDQPPHFNQSSYEFKVSEISSPRHIIGTVSATDPDSKENNAFVFSIGQTGDAASFDIDPASGQISTNTYLDREVKEIYNFLVYATDQKDGLLSTSASVVLKVLDDNDNAPKIIYPAPGKNSSVEISNKVPVGYRIMQISATDNDSGPNANLTYVLYDNSGDSKTPRFTINKKSGVILTNKDLSGDNYKVLSPTIVVKDQGLRPLTSSTTVTIIINSNLPYGNTGEEPGQQTQPTSGSNINIIIGLSVATVCIVIILVVAIFFLRRDRKRKNQDSIDQKPRQELSASSAPFTPASEIASQNKDGIPIHFDNIGGIQNQGLDITGSDDALNNSNSNDSGKGPSEGDGAELQHVGVKRIDSERQRPISINPGGSGHHNYQPMVQQQPSPQSYSSSPSYQPMEPFFPTSSPRNSHEFNNDTDYVDPRTMHPDSNVINSNIHHHHQQHEMMMLQDSGGNNPHMYGQQQHQPHNNNRHSGTAIEQWKANADQFTINNPQFHVNSMIGLNSSDNRWSHSINEPPQSTQRHHVLPRQFSEPAPGGDYPGSQFITPQYIHMQSVPNGHGTGYSLDV